MRSPATSSLGARVSGEGESEAERSDGSSLGDSFQHLDLFVLADTF